MKFESKFYHFQAISSLRLFISDYNGSTLENAKGVDGPLIYSRYLQWLLCKLVYLYFKLFKINCKEIAIPTDLKELYINSPKNSRPLHHIYLSVIHSKAWDKLCIHSTSLYVIQKSRCLSLSLPILYPIWRPSKRRQVSVIWIVLCPVAYNVWIVVHNTSEFLQSIKQ